MLKDKKFNPVHVLLFVLISILVINAGILITQKFLILNVIELDASATVSESQGIDLDIHSLTFGNVIVESPASRKVIVENKFNRGVKVEITSQGNLSPYLFVSSNDFYLGPGEKKTLDFSVFFPEGTPQKGYTGQIYIKTKKF